VVVVVVVLVLVLLLLLLVLLVPVQGLCWDGAWALDGVLPPRS